MLERGRPNQEIETHIERKHDNINDENFLNTFDGIVNSMCSKITELYESFFSKNKDYIRYLNENRNYFRDKFVKNYNNNKKKLSRLVRFYNYVSEIQRHYKNISNIELNELKTILYRFLFSLSQLLLYEETKFYANQLINFIGKPENLCSKFFEIEKNSEIDEELYKAIIYALESKCSLRLKSFIKNNKNENIVYKNRTNAVAPNNNIPVTSKNNLDLMGRHMFKELKRKLDEYKLKNNLDFYLIINERIKEELNENKSNIEYINHNNIIKILNNLNRGHKNDIRLHSNMPFAKKVNDTIKVFLTVFTIALYHENQQYKNIAWSFIKYVADKEILYDIDYKLDIFCGQYKDLGTHFKHIINVLKPNIDYENPDNDFNFECTYKRSIFSNKNYETEFNKLVQQINLIKEKEINPNDIALDKNQIEINIIYDLLRIIYLLDNINEYDFTGAYNMFISNFDSFTTTNETTKNFIASLSACNLLNIYSAIISNNRIVVECIPKYFKELNIENKENFNKQMRKTLPTYYALIYIALYINNSDIRYKVMNFLTKEINENSIFVGNKFNEHYENFIDELERIGENEKSYAKTINEIVDVARHPISNVKKCYIDYKKNHKIEISKNTNLNNNIIEYLKSIVLTDSMSIMPFKTLKLYTAYNLVNLVEDSDIINVDVNALIYKFILDTIEMLSDKYKFNDKNDCMKNTLNFIKNKAAAVFNLSLKFDKNLKESMVDYFNTQELLFDIYTYLCMMFFYIDNDANSNFIFSKAVDFFENLPLDYSKYNKTTISNIIGNQRYEKMHNVNNEEKRNKNNDRKDTKFFLFDMIVNMRDMMGKIIRGDGIDIINKVVQEWTNDKAAKNHYNNYIMTLNNIRLNNIRLNNMRLNNMRVNTNMNYQINNNNFQNNNYNQNNLNQNNYNQNRVVYQNNNQNNLNQNNYNQNRVVYQNNNQNNLNQNNYNQSRVVYQNNNQNNLNQNNYNQNRMVYQNNNQNYNNNNYNNNFQNNNYSQNNYNQRK